MWEIFGSILEVVAIALTVYEMFFKKSSDVSNNDTQINLIQQINPQYNIQYNVYEREQPETSEIKNAKWKSKRMFSTVNWLIIISIAINFIGSIKIAEFDSITDFTAMIYFPFRKTIFHLCGFLIVFCIIVIIRGWDKTRSAKSNLWSMRYFSIKVLTDTLGIVVLSFVTYEVLEKINNNIQHPVIPMNITGLSLLLFTQLLWIKFTISKLLELEPKAELFERQEKQLIQYVPAYVCSLLLACVIIYTKLY